MGDSVPDCERYKQLIRGIGAGSMTETEADDLERHLESKCVECCGVYDDQMMDVG